jgi:amidase
MSDGELMFRPATELAAMVRSGAISARELVEISLGRIEELNPKLNAFVDVDAERALTAADEVQPGDERPFAGVPIAIKNNVPVAGLRLTFGCSLMENFRAAHDHNVTRRLRDAGFVVVGTTTLPEYGILPTSEARIFGPTHNPWDLDRTPGGSSGGSAAAVASGMVPLAHGNDGGGSIRIPAACCGLVGLKPQRGRISVAPELGDSPLTTDGILTRTVADTAAVLDVLAGYVLGDATWAPPPSEPFAAAAARAPGKLRIAATTLPPIPDAAVDPLAAGAVADAAELLRSLGHDVEEVDPPWQVEGLQELFGAVFSTYIALSVAYSAMVAGRDPFGLAERGHGADELGHLFDDPQPQRRRRPRRVRAPSGAQPHAHRVPRPLRRAPHPRPRRAPPAAGHARHRRARPDGHLHPVGLLHALHPHLQRLRPAGDLAAALPRLRRPPACGPARRPARRGGNAARARHAA